MGNYHRYERRHNSRTLATAVNTHRKWTAVDETRVMKTWCRRGSSAATRVYLAQILGRTYLACAKRHAYLHRVRGDKHRCLGRCS